MVGGEPDFPEARALQYSLERWRAYLPCSGWVRESPRRCGRLNAGSWSRTTIQETVPVLSNAGGVPYVRAIQFTPGPVSLGGAIKIGGFGRLVLAG